MVSRKTDIHHIIQEVKQRHQRWLGHIPQMNKTEHPRIDLNRHHQEKGNKADHCSRGENGRGKGQARPGIRQAGSLKTNMPGDLLVPYILLKPEQSLNDDDEDGA